MDKIPYFVHFVWMYNKWINQISQKSSMAEVERDPWVHVAEPLLKQRHPEQSAQYHIQVASEDLSRMLVPMLTHFHIQCTQQQ